MFISFSSIVSLISGWSSTQHSLTSKNIQEKMCKFKLNKIQNKTFCNHKYNFKYTKPLKKSIIFQLQSLPHSRCFSSKVFFYSALNLMNRWKTVLEELFRFLFWFCIFDGKIGFSNKRRRLNIWRSDLFRNAFMP